MPHRLTDFLLILLVIFSLWGAFQPDEALDYLHQTWHGLQVIGRSFQFG